MHLWLTHNFVNDDVLWWSTWNLLSFCLWEELLVGDALLLFENLVDQERMIGICVSQLNLSLSFRNDVGLVVIVFSEPLAESSDWFVKLTNIYGGGGSKLVQMLH